MQGKGSRRRSVPMGPPALAALRAWLALRPPGTLYLAAAFRRRVGRLGRGEFPASFGRGSGFFTPILIVQYV